MFAVFDSQLGKQGRNVRCAECLAK
ncbi:MJ0042-type zinc finger domain-containing protein [Streptomyces xanthophaeus]